MVVICPSPYCEERSGETDQSLTMYRRKPIFFKGTDPWSFTPQIWSWLSVLHAVPTTTPLLLCSVCAGSCFCNSRTLGRASHPGTYRFPKLPTGLFFSLLCDSTSFQRITMSAAPQQLCHLPFDATSAAQGFPGGKVRGLHLLYFLFSNQTSNISRFLFSHETTQSSQWTPTS